MFLRTKITYAALVLGLSTAFGAVVAAQQQGQQQAQQQPTTQYPAEGRGRMGRGHGRGFRQGPGPGGDFGPGLVRGLNLTADQKQQVRTIIQQSFEGNKATREELRQLGEKRRQGTLSSDEQARARTLHEQMRTVMKDTQTKIAGALTAEQKTKVEELMKERKSRHQRGGPRRGFTGGPGQDNPPAQKPSNPSSSQ